MHPKDIRIQDYTYELPEERIARYPLAERHNSKLLVYKPGLPVQEDIYLHLSNYLPVSSLLVFNNTRVIQARLFFETGTGARIEIFCMEPAGDLASAMSSTGSCRWYCMVGKAAKWKQEAIVCRTTGATIQAVLIERTPASFLVEFTWQPSSLTFAEVLDKAGVLPIPPYLKRETEAIDLARYQTIYAKEEGSVAAPTAGLHFTPEVFEALHQKGIKQAEVTLHVGAGTFKPVKSETMAGHDMHAELMNVNTQTIEQLVAAISQVPVVAVGTTSLRTIESLYWMGLKALHNPNASLHQLEVKQWDAYELYPSADTVTALKALQQWMVAHDQTEVICKTQLTICPPYKLKVANALITNFHQPNSTLLLLIAAVAGPSWKQIYEYALHHDFRFLSYGDGSLLFAG